MSKGYVLRILPWRVPSIVKRLSRVKIVDELDCSDESSSFARHSLGRKVQLGHVGYHAPGHSAHDFLWTDARTSQKDLLCANKESEDSCVKHLPSKTSARMHRLVSVLLVVENSKI